MLTPTDLKIISILRSNARQSFAVIARKVGIPQSTLFDKVRNYEKRFVRKHTTLIDFDRLGFFTRMQIAVKVPMEKRQELQDFLKSHKNINSLYKINGGFDFLLECIFKSPADAKNFVEMIQRDFTITKICVFDLMEELKKEEFLQENG